MDFCLSLRRDKNGVPDFDIAERNSKSNWNLYCVWGDLGKFLRKVHTYSSSADDLSTILSSCHYTKIWPSFLLHLFFLVYALSRDNHPPFPVTDPVVASHAELFRRDFPPNSPRSCAFQLKGIKISTTTSSSRSRNARVYRRKTAGDDNRAGRSIDASDTSKFEQINHAVSVGAIARRAPRARDYFSRRGDISPTIGNNIFLDGTNHAASSLHFYRWPTTPFEPFSALEIFTVPRTHT